jgi:hypothetical protein
MKFVKTGLKNTAIPLSGITQGCYKQNMTKTAGARAPLVAKIPIMTLAVVIMAGRFAVYASFKFRRVPWCYGALPLITLLFFYVTYDIKKREV